MNTKDYDKRLPALETTQRDTPRYPVELLRTDTLLEIEAATRDDGSIDYTKLSDCALRDIHDHDPQVNTNG